MFLKKKMWTVVLLVCCLVINIMPVAVSAETETVLTGITVAGAELVPAFDKDVHQYTATVPSGTDLNQLGSYAVSFTVNEGGDSSKVISTKPDFNSSYSQIITVVNDAANYKDSKSYIVTFVCEGSGTVLDAECTQYTQTSSEYPDKASATDKKFWTRTQAKNDTYQIWDLGEVKEISEIRALLYFNSQDTKGHMKNWEVSRDNQTWVSLAEFSEGGSYSGNIYNAYCKSANASNYFEYAEAYLKTNYSNITTGTYARYIRNKASGTFRVHELFVIGKDWEDPTVYTSLTSLEVSSGTLKPEFSPNVTEYLLETTSFRKLAEITEAVLYDKKATLEITQPTAQNGYKGSVLVYDPKDRTNFTEYIVKISPELALYDVTVRGDLSTTPVYNSNINYGADGTIETSYSGELGSGWQKYTVDLGSTKMISTIRIWEGRTQRTDLIEALWGRIDISIDGMEFETISQEYTINPNLKYYDGSDAYCMIEHELEYAVPARYVRIQGTGDGTVSLASQMSVAEFDVLGYTITDKMISDEPLSGISRDINPLVDGEMELGGNVYDITWRSDLESIDLSTGTVTRGEKDETGKIAADLVMQGGDISFTLEFDVTVLGEAIKNLTKSYSAEAVTLEGADEETVSISPVPDGFTLETDNMFELLLEKDEAQNGTISFLSDTFQLFAVDFSAEGFLIRYGHEEQYTLTTSANEVGLKIETLEDHFNLYADMGEGYFTIFCGKGYMQPQRGFINNVKVITEGEGELALKKLDSYVCADKVLGLIEKQIVFNKITDEKPLAISKKLDLFADVFTGMEIDWSVSDDSVINIDSGDVTIPEEPKYVTLKCDISYGGEKVTKEWKLLLGMENICADKSVISSATAFGQNYASYATDKDAGTAFITSKEAGYTVDISLNELKDISHFDFFPAETEGKILKMEILSSADGKNYQKVWEGDNLEDYMNIAITPVKAKVIRISVLEAQGKNGIAELIAYYDPNDEQILNADISAVEIPDSLSDGLKLPLVGESGSTLSYECDNEDVEFIINGDYAEVSVEKVKYDTTVKVTVCGTKGDASGQKSFYATVYGSADIRNNKPSGGSSGGGGVSKSGTVSFGTAASSSAYTEETSIEKEMSSHWAVDELRYLYSKGIIKGDGETLNLEGMITRAEFVTLILRSNGTELKAYDNTFSDVKAEDWFSNYIQTAYELGIMQGDGEFMRPNDAITREEMATVLANIVKDSAEAGKTAEFTDMDDASEWAKENILAISSLGLINGYEDGTFAPKNMLRRCEAMVVIYRMMNMSR